MVTVSAFAGEVRPSDRLADFERVFNAGEDGLVDNFIAANFTDATEEKLERMRTVFNRLSEELGSISVAEIQDVRDGTVFIAGHVTAKASATGRWKSFQFFASQEHEGRFSSFAIADAIEPRPLPDGGIADPRVRAWISDHIDWLEQEQNLSGAFAVARNGEAVFEKVCGWQDHAKNTRNSKSTPFNLASGGKMITAIAIAQLVENGKLRFDDVVADHLPDYPHAKVAQAVSVDQLLTHRSGLPEYWTEAYEKEWGEITELKQILPYFADRPLVFAPGTKHEYCNTNYIVLGLILEQVSGVSYFEYIRERVLVPAGMEHAGFFENDGSGSAALAYEFVLPTQGDEKEQWFPAELGRKGTSAGGCYASLQDMFAFDRALNEWQLTTESLTRVLTTGKVKQPVGGKYGYGFMDGEYEGRRWFGHGGTGPGAFFEYMHFPDSGYTIVFLANHGGTSAHDVFRKLKQAVAASD